MQTSIFEAGAPLPHRMRPRTLVEFVGQTHLLGEGKPMTRILRGGHPPSMILWGPPGTGKTTLAQLVAQHFSARWVPFSAVSGGLPELRALIKDAQVERRMGRRTILFVDEIHRFHKGQQDAFLPYVEDGTITLVGATTENPSFEVNSALLSRVRVFTLQPLAPADVESLVRTALTDAERGLGLKPEIMSGAALEAIVQLSGGDARRALSILEVAAQDPPITPESVSALTEGATRYDKGGEEHYNVVSAFIKTVRGGDPDAALYWLARMIEAGEDALFIARRLLILASEDIGNADPHGLMVASSAMQAVQLLGMPEGRIPLAQATTYLASAPKSNAAYKGLNMAMEEVQRRAQPPVPLHLRNAPTQLMKDLGYGKEYQYPHDFEGGVKQSYWPEGFNPRRYYLPTEHGYEAQIKKRLQAWRNGG